MRLGSQSAIEFLTTYGFVFIIIAVVIAVLYLYLSLPKSTLPMQCSFFSGFYCSDVVYTINMSQGHGAQLFVIASDTQPGVVNVSSFNAVVGYVQSNGGYCAPNIATAGEDIYCVANFNNTPKVGNLYTGSFSIDANYCAAAVSQIGGVSCPATSNYIFTGAVQLQATRTSLGGSNALVSGAYYVPVNVTNSGTAGADPAHFDVRVEFVPSTYITHERTDLGNIRFFDGGTELYSWCEANCSSSASANAIFWVRMKRAVPPNKPIAIQMYFLPFNIGYDGTFAGEAPELTTPYGKYDNGGAVFPLYANFTGPGVPAGWAGASGALGTDYKVSDGLQLLTTTARLTSTTNFTLNNTLEAYLYFQGGATNGWDFGAYASPAQAFGMLAYGSGWASDWVYNDGYTEISSSGGALPGHYIFQLKSNATKATANFDSEYYGAMASNTFAPVVGAAPVAVGERFDNANGGQSMSVTIYWIRMRMTPPGGTMPRVAFGNVVQVT